MNCFQTLLLSIACTLSFADKLTATTNSVASEFTQHPDARRVRVVVELSTRRVFVCRDGSQIAAHPISIGKAASHGCLRMREEDIRDMYPLVPVDGVVEVVNSNLLAEAK